MIPRVDVPVVPDADQGRSWARDELARPGYERPGLLERGLRWLVERLQSLPLPHGTGSALLTAALVLGLGALLAWALWRAGGPLARSSKPAPDALFGSGPRSAVAHRAAADAAAAAGDWRTAVLERFRAVIRDLEERTVLAEQPGRTAGEAADAAGRRLPELAQPLRAAARSFDDVRYGDRPANEVADAELRALDARARAARPASHLAAHPDDRLAAQPGPAARGPVTSSRR